MRNYGTGEYLWKVHANSKTQDNYNPNGTIEDIIGKPEDGEWFTAAQSFGTLATWWEPKTWAHAVMNVINNQ